MQTSGALSDDIEGATPNLEEGVPLLPKKSTRALDADDADGTKKPFDLKAMYGSAGSNSSSMFDFASNDKVLSYDQDSLLTANALLHMGKSAFCQKPVLMTLAYCCVLASVSATAVFFLPKASKLDTSRFESLATFLKFFITFMLGIYVAQAFKRWWSTVTTFEKFLIAIKQMIFMLHTIKYQPDARRTVEHYCVASTYILNVEVRNAQTVDKKRHTDMKNLMDWLALERFLAEDEVEQLDKGSGSHLGKTRAVWSWVAELISHPLVEEGVTVLPPLLARTIVLCQACVSEIENLKMNITMQTPFMYAQLLAILVHVNNTILAISCGLAVGSAMNEIRRRSEQLSGERPTDRRDVTVTEQLYGAIQTCGIQLMIVLITPMLYVAFLHIAHLLCYPFGDESYHLPTETLIARLHSELKNMSENRSYFRKKHAELKEQLARKAKGSDGDDV